MSTGMPRPLSDDGDAVVVMNRDVDLVAIAGHGFVDRIVDDFPDEMVQAKFAGGSDVHRGTFAHCFDAAEDFDGSCVVLVPSAFGGLSIFISHESCVSSVAWSVVLLGKAVAVRRCSTLAHRTMAGLPCPLAPAS